MGRGCGMSNDITSVDVISRADVDRVEELVQIARDKRRDRWLDEFREMKNKSDLILNEGEGLGIVRAL
jgi:hypothetical protein